MIGVDVDTHFAAHRFGLVAKAGGKVRRERTGDRKGQGQVTEFVDADGEVIARKVTALGETLCWLRRDLAGEAAALLVNEAADYQRVVAELAEFIRSTDRQGATRNGVTVEEYRKSRHYAGMRWDNYRAKQRAGGF